ncbi:MAG: hypothetical protein LBF12_02040 [Christensenellaceae bacterium]|jgi:ATP-dependent DNA helicase RecG|nr:hypothetical protein [Christensenellaceae bacterium]
MKQAKKTSNSINFADAIAPLQGLTFHYTEKLFSNKGIPLDDAKKVAFGILTDKSYSVKERGVFTNIALLLSDQCDYSAKCVIYRGNTAISMRSQISFTGSIFKQVDDMLKYITRLNKTSSTFYCGERIDISDYPPDTINEIVHNAFVHADYSVAESSILANIYDNRIEFFNPGRLLPNVDKQAILNGISILRNPKLAKLFEELKYVSMQGIGIGNIIKSYKGNDFQPTITCSGDSFLISIPNRNYNKKLKLT